MPSPPAVLRHGVDLVEIERIGQMLAEHGERFAERCFCPEERAYADGGGRLRAQRYAVRFAAKEAVLKALGTGWRDGISWHDIEVRRSADGEPSLRLTGRCAELAEALGVARWSISLSHTSAMAMASAVGIGAEAKL